MGELIPIELGVSLADADVVGFAYRSRRAELELLDWREREVTLTFTNCVAFRWSEASDGASPAGAHERVGLSWLAQHHQADVLDRDVTYRHVAVELDVSGLFEAICGHVGVSVDAAP